MKISIKEKKKKIDKKIIVSIIALFLSFYSTIKTNQLAKENQIEKDLIQAFSSRLEVTFSTDVIETSEIEGSVPGYPQYDFVTNSDIQLSMIIQRGMPADILIYNPKEGTLEGVYDFGTEVKEKTIDLIKAQKNVGVAINSGTNFGGSGIDIDGSGNNVELYYLLSFAVVDNFDQSFKIYSYIQFFRITKNNGIELNPNDFIVIEKSKYNADRIGVQSNISDKYNKSLLKNAFSSVENQQSKLSLLLNEQ
ncbi:MAG: hypothetical protein RR565_04785 [Erysipelothrix sp.]